MKMNYYPVSTVVNVVDKHTGEVYGTGFIEAYEETEQGIVAKVHCADGKIRYVGLYPKSHLVMQKFDIEYTLTKRLQSNKPVQTIIARVSITGVNYLRDFKGDPMPFCHFAFQHEGLTLSCEGENIEDLRMGLIVKARVKNIKRRRNLSWEGEIDEILEIYNCA